MGGRHNMGTAMLLLLMLACAHTSAVWESVPPSKVDAPLSTVAVVSSDKRCQEYANALAVEFSMREGVVVAPQARTRLLLNLCRLDVSTEVDVTQTYSAGATSMLEQRDQAVRGHGMAVLTIEVDGQPIGMLNSERKRVRMVREGDPSHLHKRSYIRERVVADVVDDLAQQLVPVPEVVRRRWYRNPEPGTARALHNRAVDAERSGDLAAAIQFAEAAVDADRNPRTVAYLRTLQRRHGDTRFVETEPAD